MKQPNYLDSAKEKCSVLQAKAVFPLWLNTEHES
nr:MAG TPA: hypothetical protein [Bacteriophage sp.]